jgi:hypothetical protein
MDIMTDKEYLVEAFNKGIQLGHRYYAVQVEIADQSDYETIINTIDSIHDKLKYYKEKYNSDLTLTAAPSKVRICGYLTTDNFEDIRSFLVDDEEEIEDEID